MKNENGKEKEKKGLFSRLTENKKAKKDSCCGIELEEIPEENNKNDIEKAPKDKGNPCCQ